MGPFELFDLTGLDVSHLVMEEVYHQYYEESRYRPSLITRRRLEAGLLESQNRAGLLRLSRRQRRIECKTPNRKKGLCRRL